MTMLTRAMINEPLGSRFRVQPACDAVGFDQPGWVVTDRRTGLMIWTGGFLTISDAAERLLAMDHRWHATDTPTRSKSLIFENSSVSLHLSLTRAG